MPPVLRHRPAGARQAVPKAADDPVWARRIAVAHGAHMLSWSSIVVWGWAQGNFNSLMFTMLIHVGLISLTVVMSNPHRRLLFMYAAKMGGRNRVSTRDAGGAGLQEAGAAAGEAPGGLMASS